MMLRLWRFGAWAASAVMAAAFTIPAVPAAAGPERQDPAQQSTGDPVADAARRAREQKKKDTTKPKKVYTDEDVNHVATADPAASTDGKDAGAKDDASKNADAQGKDAAKPGESEETRWRKQFRDAYASLARSEKELEILQREDNKAQLQYYNDPQKAMEEQYTRKEINEKDAKIAAKKKEIEQQKQKISDMEEALRKAGGQPGWANP